MSDSFARANKGKYLEERFLISSLLWTHNAPTGYGVDLRQTPIQDSMVEIFVNVSSGTRSRVFG